MAGFNPSGDITENVKALINVSRTQLELQRQQTATKILIALSRQPGVDVLPAAAALPRLLNGVYQLTGHKFTHIGHGRHRDVFDILMNGERLDLVLKLGNKQSTSRDIALTLMHPEDWAKIYGAFDYGVVSEYASMVTGFDDPRTKTPEFKTRLDALNTRYLGLTNGDVGFVGDRAVIVGSSIRVIKADQKQAASSTQQIRTI